MSVLVVDPQGPRRHHLATALRGASCEVTEAATPLEAIAHLGTLPARAGFVSVADTVPASIANELRAYLGAAHAELTVLRMVAS